MILNFSFIVSLFPLLVDALVFTAGVFFWNLFQFLVPADFWLVGVALQGRRPAAVPSSCLSGPAA